MLWDTEAQVIRHGVHAVQTPPAKACFAHRSEKPRWSDPEKIYGYQRTLQRYVQTSPRTQH